jgi:hypothetical protein
MKLLNFITSGLFIISIPLLLMSSCSNNDAANTVNQATLDGNWRISLYFDNTDETTDFAGYLFTFKSSGVLEAVNGSTTVTGTWSVTSSKFNINFGSDPLFSELNDDWLIEERTSSSIKLKDDNPAQDDKLQFVKL